jgi:hypothetical protein
MVADRLYHGPLLASPMKGVVRYSLQRRFGATPGASSEENR